MRPLALLLLCGCGADPARITDEIDGMVSADPISLRDEVDDPIAEPAPDVTGPAPLDWLPPITGRITTVFGARDDGSLHDAVDIAAPIGTEVRAPADLVVRTVAYQTRAGRYLIADTDDGSRFTFAHLSHVDAVEGQRFAKGEVLGLIGLSGTATGPHLHFRVERGGVTIDPLKVFDFAP